MRTVRVIDRNPHKEAPHDAIVLPQVVPGLEQATVFFASANTESDELSVALLVVGSLPPDPSSAIPAIARSKLSESCCAFVVLGQEGRVEFALADSLEPRLVSLVAAVAAVAQVSWGWDASAFIEAASGVDVLRLKPVFMGAHSWAVTPANAA